MTSNEDLLKAIKAIDNRLDGIDNRLDGMDGTLEKLAQGQLLIVKILHRITDQEFANLVEEHRELIAQ